MTVTCRSICITRKQFLTCCLIILSSLYKLLSDWSRVFDNIYGFNNNIIKNNTVKTNNLINDIVC